MRQDFFGGFTVQVVAMDAVISKFWYKITLAYVKTGFVLTEYFLWANVVVYWLQNLW